MRVFPPEAPIELYKSGFGDRSIVDQRPTGKELSRLVDNIEDPLVIALDGRWGSGKTHFLTRWVGAHRVENDGVAATVYFDAFAHDFLDDPLIALTGVIGDQVVKDKTTKIWNAIKTSAAKLAKPAARVGLAVITAGATEVAAPIVDAGLEAGSKELEGAVDAFWKKEDGKRAAMLQFRNALVELTKGNDTGDSEVTPLVVVVDELDRCRPDFALSLLEIIKHFFSVPNVHFVLGVSLNALEHSVSARYGSNFDSERYLRRFISLKMVLPETSADGSGALNIQRYFKFSAEKMKLPRDMIDMVDSQFKLCQAANNLTLRDVNRILSRFALVNPGIFGSKYWGWSSVLTTLVLFRSLDRGLEEKALMGELQIEELHKFFGITPSMIDRQEREGYVHTAWMISVIWTYILSNGDDPKDGDAGNLGELFGAFGIDHPATIPGQVSASHLDTFSLPSATG